MPESHQIDDIKRTLRCVIEESAGIPADLITDDATVSGELAMDSLSFLSVQVAIEEAFGITCTPGEIESKDSFGAIAGLVRERLGAARERASGREK